MPIYHDIMEGLRQAIKGSPFANAAALARACGVETNLITRWINGQRTPRLDTLGPVLDAIGAKIDFSYKKDTQLDANPFDIKLAETLLSACQLLGISQDAIAKQTGMGKEIIADLLKGERKISAHECLLLCEAIGVEPSIALRRASELQSQEKNTRQTA